MGNLPPVGTLFASFLGVNPIGALLGPTGVLGTLPRVNADTLTGQQFFPHLIAQPFHTGLVVVFAAAAVMMVIGAVASLFDGSGGIQASAAPIAGPIATPIDAEGERSGQQPADVDWDDVERAARI